MLNFNQPLGKLTDSKIMKSGIIVLLIDDENNTDPVAVQYKNFFLQSTWCIFHACNLIAIVEPCQRTITEVGIKICTNYKAHIIQKSLETIKKFKKHAFHFVLRHLQAINFHWTERK